MDVINVLIALSAFLIGLVGNQFLPAYMRQKGLNLATKEDVAEITTEVKKIEAIFNVELEEIKNHYQMKMAAIDTRLATHQKAFYYWSKIIKCADIDKKNALCDEASDWWDANCIFLHTSVRDEFVKFLGYFKFSNDPGHPMIIGWDEWFKLPNLIFAEIKLPALSDAQKSIIKEQSTM